MGKTREFGTNSEMGKGKDQGSKPKIIFVYNADSGLLNGNKQQPILGCFDATGNKKDK